jgi:hypothetical protein
VGCSTSVPQADVEESQEAVRPSAVASLDGLVVRGADLFFNETFEGNGRTCGSCHRADNNLTIDAAFIARLPDDDPLFVAEFVPELAENFETPALMRAFGLIRENVDGTDDLPNKFVMRGVPHTLGLSLSITNPAGAAAPPNQRTGWSGDGAPGSGTLRDFATGAVFQHFPKTLAREKDYDFRLPTDEELDAMEAFQLFTGRHEELDLTKLSLKPLPASAGQAVFTSAGARCNGCHFNAGANVPFGGGGNFNFNTGVENFPRRAAEIDPFAGSRPDQGFGTAPSPTVSGGFGDGTFNVPPLVEAADTGPFFHNNIVDTIEEAVAFYNSDAFNNSPAAAFGRINLTTEQQSQVAAFLRVINALENIRSSRANLEFIRANEARERSQENKDLFAMILADIKDAREDLRAPDGNLSPAAEQGLDTAHVLAFLGKIWPPGPLRTLAIDLALKHLELARQELQN